MAAAAAHRHSVAVTSAGAVFAWGCNQHAQLGFLTADGAVMPTPRRLEALQARRVTAAAAAKRHTVKTFVEIGRYLVSIKLPFSFKFNSGL